MFVAASVALNTGVLPVGLLLDRIGPRVSIDVAPSIEVVGWSLLDHSDSGTFHMFEPAYIMFTFGGRITMMSSFPASIVTMRYQTAILAALSCLVMVVALCSLSCLQSERRRSVDIGEEIELGTSQHVAQQQLLVNRRVHIDAYGSVEVERIGQFTATTTGRNGDDAAFRFVLRATGYMGTANKPLENSSDRPRPWIPLHKAVSLCAPNEDSPCAVDRLRRGHPRIVIGAAVCESLGRALQPAGTSTKSMRVSSFFPASRVFLYAMMSIIAAKLCGRRAMDPKRMHGLDVIVAKD
uniref:Uncharacterized protein n=1 Tax=Peronospora matthiolae TaxID=2874970 RepID=A0AAV1T1D7_9STRA